MSSSGLAAARTFRFDGSRNAGFNTSEMDAELGDLHGKNLCLLADCKAWRDCKHQQDPQRSEVFVISANPNYSHFPYQTLQQSLRLWSTGLELNASSENLMELWVASAQALGGTKPNSMGGGGSSNSLKGSLICPKP